MDTNHEVLGRCQVQALQQRGLSLLTLTGLPAPEVSLCPNQTQTERQGTCQVSGKGLTDHLAPPSGPWCVVLGSRGPACSEIGGLGMTIDPVRVSNICQDLRKEGVLPGHALAWLLSRGWGEGGHSTSPSPFG